MRRWLLWTVIPVLSSGACSVISGLDEFEVAGEGSGGATGAGGSTSTATSSSGGGQGGGSCTESPCKLTLPQCGCPGGEQCSVDQSAGDRVCVTAGDKPEGAACGGTEGECAPGLICRSLSPTVGMCATICTSDADCMPPGGLCVDTLNDGGGNPIEGATLCTQSCDPTSNDGCDGTPGASCQVGEDSMNRAHTYCAASGAGTQGALCTVPEDCAPTYGCFSTGSMTLRCYKYCNVNQSTCNGGSACAPFSPAIVIGGIEYGACI